MLDTSESLKECLTNADKTLPLEDIVRLEVINKGANVGDKGRTRCPICLDDPPTSPVINACRHAVCKQVRAAAHREKSRVREIIGVSGVFGCAFCGRRFEKLCFEERWW